MMYGTMNHAKDDYVISVKTKISLHFDQLLRNVIKLFERVSPCYLSMMALAYVNIQEGEIIPDLRSKVSLTRRQHTMRWNSLSATL